MSTTTRGIWGALAIVLALAAQAQDRTLSVSSREPSDPRLALVIGNSAYKVGPLRNPANDARAMAAALKSSGFDVMHGENLSHRQLFEMTRDFGRKLKPGVVALFYYAGHGLQVRDRNFLIPVEADPQSEEEVPYTSVDVNFLLDVMNRAKSRVNIVILDACRNNPFARSFRSGSGGLAQMDAPSGTLIAYATAPGRVASDGGGDHGLYTQHLLKHLNTPGLPVEILFKRVREGVERETKSAQVPWESSSLKGDFYFAAAAPASLAPPPPAPVASPPGADAAFTTELAFWDAIKSSAIAADYQAYLETYPKGRFAALARSRANSLKVAAAKPAPVAAPVATLAPPPPAPTQVAAIAPSPQPVSAAPSGRQPATGERWVYQYTDQWKPWQKTQVTHVVTGVNDKAVAENLSAMIDGRLVGGFVQSVTGAEISEWRLGDIVIREFSPFALSFDTLRPGQELPDVKGMPAGGSGLNDWAVSGKVVGEEEITVPAGRFRATKVVLNGQRSLGTLQPGAGRFALTVWYAPQLKRHVKLSFESFVRLRGGVSFTDPSSRDVYELVKAPPGGAMPVAAPAPAAAPPTQVASVAPTPVVSGKAPAIGDRFTYQYTDFWKPALKPQIIHTVTEIRQHEIVETLSTVINGRTYIADAASAKDAEIREWSLGPIAMREFSPFALALNVMKPGEAPAAVRGMLPEDSTLPEWSVTASVAEENVTVPAGRFRATRVSLEGARQLPNTALRALRFELDVWYAPELKRYVKMTYTSIGRVSGGPTSTYNQDVYELVSYPR